jgi:hypothetical protein
MPIGRVFGWRPVRSEAEESKEEHMVQIAMVVCGVATGLACRSWRQAVVITLVVFAVTVAVQTPSVRSEGDLHTTADFVVYPLIQAVSLAVGLGIARFLIHRRQRRGAMV